ncbi:hypothetical protein MicroSTF_08960 [Microbacterium sp. STF-2]|uniref:hypothetical protein n=1 Tax=unclassified Microbacterium TaxID=2609290 RepID=UPI00260BBBFF|nr:MULTISPECIES: hypothetical protein [unclassified Microbacterium]MCV0334063.1 hypothetical protein [Microbacterium sp.]MCV0374409.1 hypothetical protein [Microbacterium sp.]MCV0389481.1 hypothetical protein [Microbacterium sp.]MCV0419015.1 hypothetical protein [Microbacterium sp.]MCV0421321.1 hypothetical protein [Microbacterium sp.]
MSDPQDHTDDPPAVEAQGIDPDMPSTDDGPETDEDDDENEDENDNLGAEKGKGTPPTVPPTGGGSEGVHAEDARRD